MPSGGESSVGGVGSRQAGTEKLLSKDPRTRPTAGPCPARHQVRKPRVPKDVLRVTGEVPSQVDVDRAPHGKWGGRRGATSRPRLCRTRAPARPTAPGHSPPRNLGLGSGLELRVLVSNSGSCGGRGAGAQPTGPRKGEGAGRQHTTGEGAGRQHTAAPTRRESRSARRPAAAALGRGRPRVSRLPVCPPSGDVQRRPASGAGSISLPGVRERLRCDPEPVETVPLERAWSPRTSGEGLLPRSPWPPRRPAPPCPAHPTEHAALSPARGGWPGSRGRPWGGMGDSDVRSPRGRPPCSSRELGGAVAERARGQVGDNGRCPCKGHSHPPGTVCWETRLPGGGASDGPVSFTTTISALSGVTRHRPRPKESGGISGGP